MIWSGPLPGVGIGVVVMIGRPPTMPVGLGLGPDVGATDEIVGIGSGIGGVMGGENVPANADEETINPVKIKPRPVM
jgi:hypothetical protein